MKVFFDLNHLEESIPRNYISDWIKPLYPNKRLSMYGLKEKELDTCLNIDKADLCILPCTWNYYIKKNLVDEALKLLSIYKKHNKTTVSWVEGDFLFKIPNGDYNWFHHGGHFSNKTINQYSYPVIIKDPLKKLQMTSINILNKEKLPKVGFCGLAPTNISDALFRLFKSKITVYRKRKFIDTSNLHSGSMIRWKTIKVLKAANSIKSEIIIRTRSGGQTSSPEQQKIQYWENILRCPYVLCTRGRGNFSARFYETLSMGRIPLLVDTDKFLPFHDQINWKDHCVWVEEKNVDKISSILLEFHENISKKKFKEIQVKNRILWEEKFTFDGFFRTMTKVL